MTYWVKFKFQCLFTGIQLCPFISTAAFMPATKTTQLTELEIFTVGPFTENICWPVGMSHRWDSFRKKLNTKWGEHAYLRVWEKFLLSLFTAHKRISPFSFSIKDTKLGDYSQWFIPSFMQHALLSTNCVWKTPVYVTRAVMGLTQKWLCSCSRCDLLDLKHPSSKLATFSSSYM